jgi:alanine dehydrogenase
MDIGVVKEVKSDEYRVGLTPDSVRALCARGHSVFFEAGCGNGVGLSDQEYINAGATCLATVEAVFDAAMLIVKVKEPQPEECALLTPQHILFTYLHLAANQNLTDSLLQSGASCLAYETVTNEQGQLPLLAPMSEIAGRFSVQAAAHHLENAQGGRGVLLGGAAGVAPANVLVLGAGVVGSNAAKIALGMGAKVTVVDQSEQRLQHLQQQFGESLQICVSTADAIEQQLPATDVVIGAVLIPGARTPKIITRNMLALMQAGSVLVDVSIDQGGCFETSKPTTHQQPTFVVDAVIHYCVANVPGAVGRTATFALNHATLPYLHSLADHGLQKAAQQNPGLANGLNIYKGQLTCEAVAKAFAKPWLTPLQALAN